MKPSNSALFFVFPAHHVRHCHPCTVPARRSQQRPRRARRRHRIPSTARSQFSGLSPRQQALAYWLTQASIAIDPIFYDQLSAYGLRQKRLLEEIMAYPKGIDPAAMTKIAEFAKLFWANRGNHNELTSQKFLPDVHLRATGKSRADRAEKWSFSNRLCRSSSDEETCGLGAGTRVVASFAV